MHSTIFHFSELLKESSVGSSSGQVRVLIGFVYKVGIMFISKPQNDIVLWSKNMSRIIVNPGEQGLLTMRKIEPERIFV